MPPGGTVNINAASVEALNHLKGGGAIGLTIARHRPYRSIEDLINKRVLRRSVFDQIKGQISSN
jgi:DNA uptake protein ComE-like DNA-binding protein